MKSVVFMLLTFPWGVSVAAEWPGGTEDWQESAAVAQLFEQAGVEGAFVLFDVAKQNMRGYNLPRANQRYAPAATFNLAHTLIALYTGAVKDLDEMVSHGDGDGDMSLRDAMTTSNEAVYRALARRIGPVQMQQHLSALIYGNREFGSTLDPFWHDGSLHISAVEQVRFLSLLVQDALPYPRTMLATVRSLVLMEDSDGWQLYGDTGWENAPEAGIGWWVGWLHQEGHWYTFALNMDIDEPADASQRLTLGRASLQALGLL